MEESEIEEEDYDYYFKIMLLGHISPGKTSFIRRYLVNTNNGVLYTTIGLYFRTKVVELDNNIFGKIRIWDTPSLGRYFNITLRNFFHKLDGIIILYDITIRSSFDHAKLCLETIRRESTYNHIIVFVGNKIDYEECRIVSTEEGQKFAEENDLIFYETSSKLGINVNECFNELIHIIYQNAISINNNN